MVVSVSKSKILVVSDAMWMNNSTHSHNYACMMNKLMPWEKIKNPQKMKNKRNLGFTGNLIFNAMKWGNRWWISLQEWWFYISEGVYGWRRKWKEIGRGLKIIDFLSKREKRKRWTVPRTSSNGLALCERKCCQKNITKFWNFRKMALFIWKHGTHINMLILKCTWS